MAKSRHSGDIGFYDGSTEKSLVAELARIDGNVSNATEQVAAFDERISNLEAIYPIYGVQIDLTDSNPYTSVTYTDDAEDFVPASGNDGHFTPGSINTCYPFNAIKPCMFKNGAVVKYLNPNNFNKYEDGSDADTYHGDEGDVMIEIPRFYYKIAKTGSTLRVKISQIPREGFTDFAFKYKGVSKEKFYVGAYLGVIKDNRLRSITGYEPDGDCTIGEFRTYAQNNGNGYEQLSFNKLTALQVLFLLMFKSRDSQTALGRGNTDNDFLQTGQTTTSGMNFGDTSASHTVKFMGIEDFWGNKLQWIDGYYCNNGAVYIADGDFNDDADGYTSYSVSTNIDGFISDVAGDNVLAFTPQGFNASNSTHFCDYGSLYAGCVPVFGGCAWDWVDAGAFYLHCEGDVGDCDSDIGSRLVFCG